MSNTNTQPTLRVFLTKQLGLEGGKYTVMCIETSNNIQFNTKRDLMRAHKNGDLLRMDWGL
tara:strand:+ start:361 stop:543 length:183 start_codon:yes stop_codon:yes gene_type:complete